MAVCPVIASPPRPSSSFADTVCTLAQICSLLFSILRTFCLSCWQSLHLGARSVVLSLKSVFNDRQGRRQNEVHHKANGSCRSQTETEGERDGFVAETQKLSSSLIYEGRVWHERRHPVVHKFDYRVRYAFVNLDSPPSWYLSSAAKEHLSAEQARTLSGTSGTVYLLTMLRSVGYEQNPLSVYYCYGGDSGDLMKCIAEVTNTPWGERVTFTFEPRVDTVAKPLHVSPFMDMLGSWRMLASAPGESLQLTIQVQHPQLGDYFVANLRMKKVNDKSIGSPEAFLWLMPHKVALWIYWQAIILLWKGVKVQPHPKDVDGSAYRDRARARDAELRSSQSQGRLFRWREAGGWPWT